MVEKEKVLKSKKLLYPIVEKEQDTSPYGKKVTSYYTLWSKRNKLLCLMVENKKVWKRNKLLYIMVEK